MANPSSSEGRRLPHSLDAERAVLGSILLDNRTLPLVQERLRPELFYNSSHRLIYQAIHELNGRGTPIDLTTLCDFLMQANQLDAVGGPAYLASLEQYVVSTANISHHVQLVHDKARMRELLEAGGRIQEMAVSETAPVDEILNLSEKLVYDISQDRPGGDFETVASVMGEAMEEIDHRYHHRQEVTGLPTGYTKLDEMTTGFHPSELVILASRPSVGKTALALNIAAHVAVERGLPVGIFSLEMSRQQLAQRLLSVLSRVPLAKLRKGIMSRAELEKLTEKSRLLGATPIYLDDTPGLNILELRAKARRLQSRVKNLSLLVVDYLQLMRGIGRQENRQQEVAEITRSLKALARELNIPVLALSQLSRLIEQRKGRNVRPMLSDLRESGAIEQDADIVLFIHRERDKKEGAVDEQAKRRQIEIAELIIGKARNGPVGEIELLFIGELTRFENLAAEQM
ncbi:MAG: replicative DNA helicase [bacterium]